MLKIIKHDFEYSGIELYRCTEIHTTEDAHEIILWVVLIFSNNRINKGHFIYQSILTGIMKQVFRLLLCILQLSESLAWKMTTCILQTLFIVYNTCILCSKTFNAFLDVFPS